MSHYNKVIQNKDGITVEQLEELIAKTVKGSEVFVNIPNKDWYSFPYMVKGASSMFGHLYIDVPDVVDQSLKKDLEETIIECSGNLKDLKIGSDGWIWESSKKTLAESLLIKYC